VRLNGRTDAITCFTDGVAGENADRDLYLGSASVFFPTLIPPPGQASATRTRVRCTTLDSILDANDLRRVDLLKMDIEGAEYEVLYRARACFDRILEIRMEYHDIDRTEQNVDSLKRFLTAHGYRISRERASTPTNGTLWAVRR